MTVATFQEMRRRQQDSARRMRGDTKQQERRAAIARLLPGAHREGTSS